MKCYNLCAYHVIYGNALGCPYWCSIFFFTKILFYKNKGPILEHFSFTWLSNTLIFAVKEWYSYKFFWQILNSWFCWSLEVLCFVSLSVFVLFLKHYKIKTMLWLIIIIFQIQLVNMSDRTWMYSGWQRGKAPSSEWMDETTKFLDHAFSNMDVAKNDTIKCPCAMCRNYFGLKKDIVAIHLCKHGFREGYETWTEHGESHLFPVVLGLSEFFCRVPDRKK